MEGCGSSSIRERMSGMDKELVMLILKYLDEEKYEETVHRLEKESGVYFNMKYFEDLVTNGDWDGVEDYLLGFTKIEENRYSMKTFFEIRKQKYLEALDRQDNSRAVEILRKELKVFCTLNEELYKEITQLLALSNFRENEQLRQYGDTKSTRAMMFGEVRKMIEANPDFHEKLQFPIITDKRLRRLINQSLNWQHQLCENPNANPEMKTLLVDHVCEQPNGAQVQQGPLNVSLEGCMASIYSMTPQDLAAGPSGIAGPSNAEASTSKRPWTPAENQAMDSHYEVHEHVLKRTRTFGTFEEGNNVPVYILPVTTPGQNHAQSSSSSDDLPKIVVANLNQGSAVKSMDFHPVLEHLLLVGTSAGDISIWDVGSGKRLVFRNFNFLELGECSEALHAALANEYTASVNRVVWCGPRGFMFGVAFSKHIVHLYVYGGDDELHLHREIDAHIGSVNDLSFAHLNGKICVITCGEDKTIKVWVAIEGQQLYTFEGHEAPVYSICPHFKENIPFVFSTDIDGKIKAWLYTVGGSRVDYDAHGQYCTKMSYSTDGRRLFSCGTNKEGQSHIVEWNETEGTVTRMYHGLGKRSVGVVQFDTTKNRYLAAGDEFVIKIWDMDNIIPLMTIDAGGGLPASPCIRFNKEGTLLAVTTRNNGVKILANPEGIRVLRGMENC